MPNLAAILSPTGEIWFLCHAAPGMTRDAAQAIPFASREIAARAARNAIYGDSQAFWPSERASAENTRRRMNGWQIAEVM